MRVAAIDHIHVNVQNLDRAIGLFTALTGSQYAAAIDIEETRSRYAWNDAGVDLNHPTSPDSAVAKWIATRGEGVSTIAFGVGGMHDRIAEAEAIGLRLVSRIGYEGVEDQAQFHPKDAFGVQVELLERLAGYPERPVDAFHQVVDHVHVYVEDLSKAVALFTSLTGHEFSAPVATDEIQARSSINALGLDVIQPTSPDSPIARAIQRRGEGVHAVALRTASIEAGIARAQSAGLKLISQIGYEGVLKQAQFHPRDSFGVMVEFVERLTG